MTDEKSEYVQELPDLFVGVGAMKLTGGEKPTISFTVSLSATRDHVASYLPFIAEMTRMGNAYATFKMTQTKLPETVQAELPLDGPIDDDPFPAWEKLMDEADVPICECPAIDDTVYPVIEWNHGEDGAMSVTIHHLDADELKLIDFAEGEVKPALCPLKKVTISTLDFTETEDFNKAIVKARGRKIVAMPFDEDDGTGS